MGKRNAAAQSGVCSWGHPWTTPTPWKSTARRGAGSILCSAGTVEGCPRGKKLSVNSVACSQKGKIAWLCTRRAAARSWNLSLFHISHLVAPLNILKHCVVKGKCTPKADVRIYPCWEKNRDSLSFSCEQCKTKWESAFEGRY